PPLALVSYVPVSLLLLTQAVAWQAINRRDGISTRQVGGLFLNLGFAAYTVALTFVFLLYRSGDDVSRMLGHLSVPLALAGLPLLVGGAVASRRLHCDDPSEWRGAAGFVATSLSLGGAFVMLLALVAAWPDPTRLTLIAALNAAALGCV